MEHEIGQVSEELKDVTSSCKRLDSGTHCIAAMRENGFKDSRAVVGLPAVSFFF